MAQVGFKKGLLANLPNTYSEGTLYITTDERALYLDVSNSARVRLGDFQEFATVAALEANTNPSTTALYYVTAINCLAKWDGSKYIQINLDTGATSVEVTGNGNVITTASYDPSTRKLTLTKGSSMVASVGATANKGIEIGGTATAPTVGVKLSATSGNALSFDNTDGGLYVSVGAAPEYTIAQQSTAETGYAATYYLTKDGTQVGSKINIPKDFLVKSASIQTVTTADVPYQGAKVGDKYIDFVINAKDSSATAEHLYLPVNELVDVYTSGSASGDMVVIAIDSSNKITATITDGTVTLAKLASAVQTEINKAHTHSNKSLLDTYDQTNANISDAVSKKHSHSNASVLDGISSSDVSAWDGEIGSAAAIAAIKDGTSIDSFGDVETALSWGSF